MTRPISRWLAELWPAAMMRGFKESTARYGALLSHVEMAVVNGFVYLCPRPVGAPKSAKGPPPKLVFKFLALVHPEIRRRIRRSREVFEQKLWREDIGRWDHEWRPAIDKTNAALQAVDPDALDDAALMEHLDACRAALDHAVYLHHSLNMCSMLPTGDFLAQTTAWTTLPATELLALLRGASPVSVGAAKEMDALTTALANDADSLALLTASVPAADVLAALRRAPSDVGAAANAYLEIVGLRTLSGYDVADCYALEMPDVLVTAIRSAVRARASRPAEARETDGDLDEATARVRERVPTAHREEFDSLLADARDTYRIRDERGYSNDARTTGLTRRALLVAGKRLAASGRLAAADHVVDLSHEELRGLLAGGTAPSAKDIAAYAEYRMTKATADVPARLGFEPSGPPPAEWLPAHAARGMRAMGAMMSAMFDVSAARRGKTVVQGLPASAGMIEGVARVVSGPSCFSRVQRGDILVAQTTSPTYNVLLPTIGGIVTDRGGLLSHAAIVAREYGLPGVVGTVEGTTAIADGRRVRVNGSSGEVFLL